MYIATIKLKTLTFNIYYLLGTTHMAIFAKDHGTLYQKRSYKNVVINYIKCLNKVVIYLLHFV